MLRCAAIGLTTDGLLDSKAKRIAPGFSWRNRCAFRGIVGARDETGHAGWVGDGMEGSAAGCV